MFMDVIVALLLVVTIGYAIRLNKRLGMLRRDKAELEKLAATFADSTVRADESLGRLRSTADQMQQQITLAQRLHDDLVFLLNRGEKAADRLEDVVRVSRDFDRQPAKPVTSTASDAPSPNSATPRSDDKHLVVPEIDGINTGMPRPAPTVTPREDDEISTRTEAERELLKALRSAN
jgi:hypothetical protein